MILRENDLPLIKVSIKVNLNIKRKTTWYEKNIFAKILKNLTRSENNFVWIIEIITQDDQTGC